MQNEIEEIGQNVINEMWYDENGVIRFTMRGSGRLVNVSHQSISKNLGGNLESSGLGKFLSQCGIEVATLDIGTNGIPDYIHALITKYYAHYAGRYCTDLAKKADLFFASVGVREWGKKQLGVDEQPKFDVPQTYSEALRLAADLQEQNEKLEQEKEQSQTFATQLLKVNELQKQESEEYKQCKNIVKQYAGDFDISLDSSTSEQINEMTDLLFELKHNLNNLLEDITNQQECYSFVSVTKWCAANNEVIPKGVKRWLSRYAKAVSQYCQIGYYFKGQVINGIRYDNTEFHPKVIKFVKDQHDLGLKQKKMMEAFEKLINNIEARDVELLNV